MNNNDKLNDLYQSRKKQFTAPDTAKFKAAKEKPFWKNWTFYSSISAFSLALVIVVPMINNQNQSDLIIMEQAFDPQKSLNSLNEMDQFSAQPVLSAPSNTKKEASAIKKIQTQSQHLSERKKSDPCKEKRAIMAKLDAMPNNETSKSITSNEIKKLSLEDCVD